MDKKIIVIIALVTLIASFLSAEKSLERLGNEAEYAGDEAYNAGNRAEAAEKYEEALQKLKAAHEKDGIPVQDKIDRIHDKIFKAYYFSKNYTKAIEILNIQLKNSPSSKTARTIAQIYEKNLNDIDKAIQTLVSFNEKDRNYIVEKKIASYYTDKEDFQNALKWYEKAYELKQDSDVIKNIATLYLKLNKKAEAIKAYENFIKTEPSERVLAKTFRNMGALYEDMNNETKSIEYYEKSNNLKYNDQITLLLITKYYDAGNFDLALKNVKLLLQNDPENVDAVYYRAMINYDQGNRDQAKADFQKLEKVAKYSKIAKGYIESIESE